jgi:hypothetical protein
MMRFRPRFITELLVGDSHLVKTRKFANDIYVGDHLMRGALPQYSPNARVCGNTRARG